MLLFLATATALVMDNSPLQSVYDAFLTTPVTVQIGVLSGSLMSGMVGFLVLPWAMPAPRREEPVGRPADSSA